MHLIFFFLSRSSLIKPSSSSSVLKLVYEFKIYCSKFFDKKTKFQQASNIYFSYESWCWFCFFLWRIWQRDQGLLIRLIRWKTLKRYYFPLFLFCQFSCFRKLQVYNTFCLWIIYLSLLGIGVFEYFRSWLKIWEKSRRQRISPGGELYDESR